MLRATNALDMTLYKGNIIAVVIIIIIIINSILAQQVGDTLANVTLFLYEHFPWCRQLSSISSILS